MRIALEHVKEKTTTKLEKVQDRLDNLRLERFYNISDMLDSYKYTAPPRVVNINGVRFQSIVEWARQKKNAPPLGKNRGMRGGRRSGRSHLPPVRGLPLRAGSATGGAALSRAERSKQLESLHTKVYVHANRLEAPSVSPFAADDAW